MLVTFLYLRFLKLNWWNTLPPRIGYKAFWIEILDRVSAGRRKTVNNFSTLFCCQTFFLLSDQTFRHFGASSSDDRRFWAASSLKAKKSQVGLPSPGQPASSLNFLPTEFLTYIKIFDRHIWSPQDCDICGCAARPTLFTSLEVPNPSHDVPDQHQIRLCLCFKIVKRPVVQWPLQLQLLLFVPSI